MASRKISQLPEASEFKIDDLVPIVQDGENKAIPGGLLKSQIGGGDVVGPASAVGDNFASFSGVSGKAIKDSGKKPADFETAGAATAAVAGHVAAVSHPTAGEKAALAGTSGTPGSGNKFVTDADSRMTNARTPTSHTHPLSQVSDAGTMAAKNDAPSDGKTYGRKDGAWAEATGGTGDVAGAIHAADGKTTPADNDEFGIADSAASYGLKKVLWSAIKTALNSLYDAAGAAQYYAGVVASALSTHEGKSTDAHGGIVASNDSRLADARTPTAHAATHVTGGDTVASAVAGGNAGLMTGADKTKLDGIAAEANKYAHPNHSGDVTSVADGAQTIANKQTLTATAPITLSNSPTVIATGAPVIAIQAATNLVNGYMTATQATKLDGIEQSADVTTKEKIAVQITASTAKNPPVDADAIIIADSEDPYGTPTKYYPKKVLWSVIKSTLKTYFDTLYAALTHATRHKSGGADAIKLDELAAPTDVTTLDASTTLHGLEPKAVAPAAGLRSVLAIDNGETARSDKALFDATTPQPIGAVASAGSGMTAARIDHVHTAAGLDSCTVFNNAVQEIANNTETAATWNSEDHDSGTMHDNSTNPSRITVPATNKYTASANVQFEVNAGGIRYAYIRKNGTTRVSEIIYDKNPDGTYVSTLHIETGTLALTSSDYLEVIVYQNSGTELDIGAASGTIKDGVFSVTSQAGAVGPTGATGGSKTSESVTSATHSVVDADNMKEFNNTGASAEVNHTLDSTTVDYEFWFRVTAAYTLKITAPASTTIRVGGTVSKAAGYVSSATIGDLIHVKRLSATEFVAENFGSGWTVEIS
jgi:hypothetical protein